MLSVSVVVGVFSPIVMLILDGFDGTNSQFLGVDCSFCLLVKFL